MCFDAMITAFKKAQTSLYVILVLSCVAGTASAEQFGPHVVNFELTPLAQRSLRQGEVTANVELDITGHFRLRPQGDGVWGESRFKFWVLGTDTLGGTRSTSEFSQRAGLLWDTNDGDSPDPYLALALGAFEQDIRLPGADLAVKLGKLYPAQELGVSYYYGDDRGTFFSQMLGTDVSGRWADTIGLGTGITFTSGATYSGALIVDATAQDNLFDLQSLRNGEFLYAAEIGRQFDLMGRNARVSALPFHVDGTADLSAETGLALHFEHDLTRPAGASVPDRVLFGRYTYRTGGDPRSSSGSDDAKPLRHGCFFGMAFNRTFGREAQQVGLVAMYGAPSNLSQTRGFDLQYGAEGFWTVSPNRYLRCP